MLTLQPINKEHGVWRSNFEVSDLLPDVAELHSYCISIRLCALLFLMFTKNSTGRINTDAGYFRCNNVTSANLCARDATRSFISGSTTWSYLYLTRN